MPLIFLVLFLLVVPEFSHAVQNNRQPTQRIALSFANDDFNPTNQQIEIADELGIRLFEISDPSTATRIQNPNARFLVDAGPHFMVPGLLQEELGPLANRLAGLISDFRRQTDDRVVAVSLFRYPFETYNGFPSYASALIDSIETITEGPFFYHSALPNSGVIPEGFNFLSKRVAPGSRLPAISPMVHLVPSVNSYQTYQTLNQVLDSLHSLDESVLVIPARWFFSQLNDRPELRYLVEDYLDGQAVTLPLPEQPEPDPFMNWSVILLLLIWGSYALHLRYQPIYSQSMARYFSNHSFFVNDVMENRLRNVLPGTILLIQHALLTGLFVFACVEVLVSSHGLQVLNYYFQPIMFSESILLSLFVSSVIATAVLQLISVLWIYVLNKKLTSFSQVLNLYSWPLHLNLIVVTFLVVFNRVGFDEIWMLILGAVFLLIWFFSFNIAAIDSSKFLENGRTIFLLATLGIHVLLIIGIFVYVFFSPTILEPILFSTELP